MSTNVKPEDGEYDGGNVEAAEAAEAAEQPERPKTPDMECPICLDELTDVCCTDMCRHLFCCECLRQWSTIQSFCPICMTNFNYIIDLSILERNVGLNETQIATRILNDTVYTVVLNSDVEENVETDARRTPPEVTVLDSSSDDSEIEFIGIIYRPIETYEPSSASSPSTSTGVRYTLERPNNNFTSRFLSTRRMRTLNCPSSDEDSTSDIPTVSRTVCRKRKRQGETNTYKKMKKSTGEQQTIVGRRSHSESSSSGEEDV